VPTSAAEPESTLAPAEESVVVLPAVVVVGVTESPKPALEGVAQLDAEALDRLPETDGNVEDALKFLPAVQLTDKANTSFQGGEIVPPLLSISGARFYENNFRIDGLGNNSLLDPLEDNPNLIDRLPGHPEEFFLDSNLVKSVKVYDHNVPVRFGGFIGGVVDVETIDPADKFSGSVHYMTTRDEWTRFHVDSADQQDFETSSLPSKQPRFTKHRGGFDLSLPVTASSGFLLAYQFSYSKIPLAFLGGTFTQDRLNQNYLLKFVSRPGARRKITVTTLYSPYRGTYYTKDTLNGEFELRGGGGALLARYETPLAGGMLDLRAGVRRSENAREAAKDYLTWTNSASKDWGALVGSSISKEGGFGNLDIRQDSYEVTADYLSDVVRSGPLRQRLGLGGQWLLTEGYYDRDETSYAYRTSVPTTPPDPTIVCNEDFTACVPAEQYLMNRNAYGVTHTRARINRYALYFDDQLTFGRMDLRPGVRISYDDLMKNLDVAPRISAGLDLFGTGDTRLIGGWSRYYGDLLLTYKLHDGIALTDKQTRTEVINNDVEWTSTGQILISSQFSDLKTPYTDEVVVGVDQSLCGGIAELRYVQRKGRDELALEQDPYVANVVRYSRLNNRGSSRYESIRLSWARDWSSQSLHLAVEKSESNATHADYDSIVRQVYYNGALVAPEALPRSDFNRPWVASMIYAIRLPYGVLFTNTTEYRQGYEGIVDSGSNILVDGIAYDRYEHVDRPSSTVFDWKLAWNPPRGTGENLTLTLELLNVFNARVYADNLANEYELGRQFWLGARYSF